MMLAVNILSALLLIAGSVFILIGGIGVMRMPGFYTRLHAASITDTLGALLIILGLMLLAGWSLITVKLLMILALLFLTSPTASHALAKAARSDGLQPHGVDNDSKTS